MAIDEALIINSLVDSKVALKYAEKALELVEALRAKVTLLEAREPKAPEVNPYTAIFGNEVKLDTKPEPVEGEPVKKLSPFNVDLGKVVERAAANQGQSVTEEERIKQEIWDMSVTEDDGA